MPMTHSKPKTNLGSTKKFAETVRNFSCA